MAWSVAEIAGRRSVRVGVGVLAAVALVLFLLWVFQRRLIYFPDRSDPGGGGGPRPHAPPVRLADRVQVDHVLGQAVHRQAPRQLPEPAPA
jgi:hypothetical protein